MAANLNKKTIAFIKSISLSIIRLFLSLGLQHVKKIY